MEITYWSDIGCPFCYIGSHRVKKAIKELNLDTHLELKSFQLDPTAPEKTNHSMLEHFTQGDSSQNGMAKQKMAYIEQMAHGDGLPMDLAKAVPTSTMDAHRLIKYVKAHYDEAMLDKVIARLYKVYFVDGKSIADHDVLLDALTELGLKRDELQKVLDSNEYHDDVIRDEQEAYQLGVQGVPFFVINHKYAISGAQPYDVIKQALQKINDEEVAE